MNKIRKGDEVIVLAGKDKGKRGRVQLRKDDQYVVVEGINLVKKHTKPNPMKGTTGASGKRPCRSTSPTWRSTTLPPARPTAWASRSTATTASACSSRPAKKS